MTTSIRQNQDCLLFLKLQAPDSTVGDNPIFGDVATARVYLVRKNASGCSDSHTHIPTATATNACCNQRDPSDSTVELDTGPILNTDYAMTVEALIPAGLLTSGYYSIMVSWFVNFEYSALGIDKFKFSKDFTDTITVVEDNASADDMVTVINYTQETIPNTPVIPHT